MGASFSNPIDDEKQARMKEIIQEVVGVFSKAFPLAYKDALIQKIKLDAQPSDGVAYYLETPPIPTAHLQEGMLTKRGDSHKSWKARHFIAHNEADNFRVDYFECEGGKMKGSISLSGYRPEHYTPDEAKENSCEFGLKLVPHDSRRRVWWMKCKDKDDRAAWMNTFQTGCYKARAPLNEDPLISEAFMVAFRATRWNYGYYSHYSVDLTEIETLSQFVTDILERELLNDVYNSIPVSPTKASTINMLKQSVDTTVTASVGAAFNGGLSACSSMKSALESAVKSALGPIFEKEVGIKVQITKEIGSKINPFCADVGSRICAPVVRAVTEPFTQTFCQTSKGIYKLLKSKVDEDKCRIDVLDATLKQCGREVYHWNGPLENTNQLCQEMYTGKLAMVESFFADGFSLYTLHQFVLEKNRQLAQCAIYTFGQEIKTCEGAVDHSAILNGVMGKMFHDAKVVLRVVLVDVLNLLLEQSVATKVTTPCTEVVAPVQAVIDQLPGVGEFFNLPSMLDSIVSQVVTGAISAVVDAGYPDCTKLIDAAGKEVGITSAM